MGVSGTSASSSNYAYDPYAMADQSNPQDSGATGNDSGGSNSAPASSDNPKGNTDTSVTPDNGQPGGNAGPTPGETQTQNSGARNSGTQDSSSNNTSSTSAAEQSPQPLDTRGNTANMPAPAGSFAQDRPNPPAQQFPPVNPMVQQGPGKIRHSGGLLGTIGESHLDGVHRPPSSHEPAHAQPQSAPPLLNGVTQSELTGLIAKYDAASEGPGHVSRNSENDANTGRTIQQANDLDYTGYAPEVRDFENRMMASQTQLAALPPEMRDYYAGQLAALDTVYRDTPDADARSELDKQTQALQTEILAEYNHSINDPLDTAMAVFNHPVGAGYLDKTFQSQLGQLDKSRDDFLHAQDAARREEVFKQATQLKTQLQQAASNGANNYLKEDLAAWDEAFQYADKLVADAGKMQDPSKRFKSIGDGLFSFNTGMGEDSVADRRVLAFTQRMMDDPDLCAKLNQFQNQAAQPLNKEGVPAATPYPEILKNLPAPGPDYVRDLGDAYTNAIKGQTQGERQASFNKTKPYLQAAEGLARFMLGLTPLAPLSTLLDGASTLTPGQRLGIDIGSGIAGALVDPLVGGVMSGAKSFSRFLQDFRTEAAAAEGSGQELKLGMESGQLALTQGEKGAQTALGASEPRLSTSGHMLEPTPHPPGQGGEAGNITYQPAQMGPSLDPRMLEARARIEGNPMAIPSRYAIDGDPASLHLAPDENAPGVLVDASKQHYIRSGDQYFKAKYDSDNDTWRVMHPESKNAFSYPVRYDPQSGTWSVHGDVGGPGGGPLSRLVSLGKYAKSDPRIARLIESKVLKPQDPQTCFLDHGRVAQQAAGVPDGRLSPVSNGPLNADQLRKELDKGPLVLSARNIARPDSDYSGMHTVVLLKTVNEDGHDYVLGIDLDDTIGRNGQMQDAGNGDFGGVKYDLDQLTRQAAPYVDEDTHAQLEMYHRPQENKGIWGWFS